MSWTYEGALDSIEPRVPSILSWSVPVLPPKVSGSPAHARDGSIPMRLLCHLDADPSAMFEPVREPRPLRARYYFGYVP